jgi:hypothetical protein
VTLAFEHAAVEEQAVPSEMLDVEIDELPRKIQLWLVRQIKPMASNTGLSATIVPCRNFMPRSATFLVRGECG